MKRKNCSLESLDRHSCSHPSPLCYSVPEFCKAVGIGIRTFYSLGKNRPAITRIGRRVLIRVEAAQQWLEAQEGL